MANATTADGKSLRKFGVIDKLKLCGRRTSAAT